MYFWKTDNELFKLAKQELFTALVDHRDGVIVVPKETEEEAFTKALEKARGEKLVLKALQGGMSAEDAFNKFGIM